MDPALASYLAATANTTPDDRGPEALAMEYHYADEYDGDTYGYAGGYMPTYAG